MKRKSIRKDRKGQLSGASNIAIGLITLVLIVAVGAIVIGDFQDASSDDNCAGSDDWTFNESNDDCYNSSNTSQTKDADSAVFNSTADGLTGLTNMSAQFGTVGTVAIAAVLISLVVGAFAVGRR